MSLKTVRRPLPQSLFGRAIESALGQWPTLGPWLEDGRIEIDNSRVENAIRPTAVGKKNWLFVGDADAGQRGAILYTLIESCRRRGIDPHAYLRDALARAALNDQLADQRHHARGMGQIATCACRSISVVGPPPT